MGMRLRLWFGFVGLFIVICTPVVSPIVYRLCFNPFASLLPVHICFVLGRGARRRIWRPVVEKGLATLFTRLSIEN
jgi:hypothetical protein